VEAGIPVRVRNSYRPDSKGTEIRKSKPSGMILEGDPEAASKAVASITYKRHQVLVNVYSTRMLGASGFLRRVFEVFDRLKIPVDHIATSEVNITVTLKDNERLAQLQAELAETAKVDVVRGVGIISVVGEFLSATPGVAARLFGALRDFNIIFITHGGASTNVSFVVQDADVDNAVRCLHGDLFDGAPASSH
jgi:aspartate kinase